MNRLILMKILTALFLFLFSGCEYKGDYHSGDPIIQQGLAEKEKLQDEMDALAFEIDQYNREYDQLDEQIQQYKEQFEEYRKRSNAFLLSLNEEQLKLYQKVEAEAQSMSQTGSTSLSAGFILAQNDFLKSLSEQQKEKEMALIAELYKLEEKRQGLMASALKLDEQGQKLSAKRERLIRQQEQNRQLALEYMKLLPYKWQQQQRAIDRFNENWQRQLDRQYYDQPGVIPLSPQWPTYHRDASGNYRPQ